MRVGFIVVAFSVLGMCPPAPCQQATTGTVAGCVTDASGGTLPGVVVTSSGSGITAHAVTNATGCYVLAKVPVGTYVVEAKLLGFRTERRSDITVSSGAEVRVDLSMCVGVLGEVMWVEPASYAALLRTAHAVVDVRITRTVPALDDCFAGWDHTVTILRVVKQSESISAEQSTLTFRQLYWAGEREPYPVGAELVLALSKTRDRIERAGGPMGVFIVKGNAVQLIGPWTVGSSYNGMELNAFLAELGRLAR